MAWRIRRNDEAEISIAILDSGLPQRGELSIAEYAVARLTSLRTPCIPARIGWQMLEPGECPSVES